MAVRIPRTISFVYFDLGNVLLSFSWEPAGRAIAAQSPFTADEVERRFRAVVPWEEFELGDIEYTRFFERAMAAVEFGGPGADFEQAFSDIFQPIAGNLELVRQLKAEWSGRLGLLSNTNPAHIAFIDQTFPEALAPFDLRLYSYDLHLRKPDPRIYQAAGEAAQTAAGNILFIDDLEANVAAAREAGWQAIRYVAGLDLAAALAELPG